MSEPIPGDVGSFTQGDDTWKKLRHRCLNDLYWFASVVLGYGDQIPMRPEVHALLCKFIERKTGSPLLDNAKYRKVEMPRETGKTTLITQGHAIQRICADRNVSILIHNENEGNCKTFLSAIKWQFEHNELLRALFPEVIPPDMNDTVWSATAIIVNRDTGRKEPTVFIGGVGATKTGMHPDYILNDDIISREAMENARAGSRQIIEQTNRWINQQYPIVNKGAKPFPMIDFIGTRWWHNDSYEYIEDAFGNGEQARSVLMRGKLPNGQVQSVECWRKGDLAMFRRAAIEDGRSIFPEKWDLEELAKIRMRDPALFACNYMNQPTDDVTATFKADWLKHFHWLDEKSLYFTESGSAKHVVRQLADLEIVILIDPGGFGTVKDERVRPAVIVVGDDFKGNYFLLDCYAADDTYLGVCKQVSVFVQTYRPRKIYVERAGQQAAFSTLLRDRLTSAGHETTVDDTTIKPEGAMKEKRILEMEPYFERGQVYVGTSAAFHEFKRQYEQFPRGARRDVLDILGYWPRVMRKGMANLQRTRAQQEAQARQAYLQRRAFR